MSKVVVINGHPESGKDTFVRFCGKYTTTANFSSVDPAKRALTILGWNGEKTPKMRKALSDLKDLSTELFDGPVNYIKCCVGEVQAACNPPEIIFVHAREPEELRRYKDELGAIIMLIDRPTSSPILNHADEGVYAFNYDVAIVNDGTLEDLEWAAQNFVKDLLGGTYDG